MAKKKKNSEMIDQVELLVTANRYDPDTLFLRNAVGDAKMGDLEIEISQGMGGEMIVRPGNGTWYVFPVRAFVDAVLRAEGIENAK